MREDDNTRNVATFIARLLYAGMSHKRAIAYGYEFAYALLASEADVFEETTESPRIRGHMLMQSASLLLVDAVQASLNQVAAWRREEPTP